MGAKLKVVEDPLFAGFYSLPDAARLLGQQNTQKIRGWLSGWNNGQPILLRDFEDPQTVSFLDLIELRFVDFFRSQGVPLQTLRKAAERARKDWDTTHPFALSDVKYMTDRRKVFAQAAEAQKDKVTWDMATGQTEMWAAIESVVAQGVVFDPRTALAKKWTPRAGFSNVIVDPRIAFGKPIVESTMVPTKTLYRQWKADQSYESVAEWFKVDVAAVKSAVMFEIAMAA
ncbi:hypothetical protein BBF93_18400 [Hyphomonas sp. CACIAM 19H1]|uniref:DUF433 domain-containing protein n=1 Tax=Hyphomonas sp. CACIAM 19H1 TaxID=1873716 RepID=UPI000DEE19D4|nr:DUF433 domain-containing protein [Hyphomonas sp. CACIAM 19H1]AXE65988.1 hypothetical protein BBF93_18400 [Hyphomonas sp. CACIAM 19H1]